MRINTNISALNSYKNLTATQAAVNSSMQRLSSGFRLNRAADDAAGLGIANQLRASTRSLNAAYRNAEQANSMLQIAEGATNSIQKTLERMKELATQAGSDTVDSDGRTRIQGEFDALKDEITRTVNTTKFQGQELLKGVNTAGAGNIDGETGISALNQKSVDGTSLAESIAITSGTILVDAGLRFNDAGNGQITLTLDSDNDGTYDNGTYNAVIQADRTVTFTGVGAGSATVRIQLGDDYASGTNAQEFNNLDIDMSVADNTAFLAASQTTFLNTKATLTIDGYAYGAGVETGIDFTATTLATGTYRLSDDGTGRVSLQTTAGAAVFDSNGTAITGQIADGTLEIGGVVITLGADYDSSNVDRRFAGTADAFEITATSSGSTNDRDFLIGSSGAYTTANTGDYITLAAINLTTAASGLNIDAVDLTTAANARTAMSTLDTAINAVNTTLGDIGAFQNRVESAMENLKTSIMNYTAAESVIRDVDMAEEMTRYAKNQILVQAGTAMLAQANQSAQGVLQLLRG